MRVQVRVRLTSATRIAMQKLFKLPIDAIYSIPNRIYIVDDEDEIIADTFIISGKKLYLFNFTGWEGDVSPMWQAKTKDGYALFQETMKRLKLKPDKVPAQYNKIFMYGIIHMVTNKDDIPYLLSLSIPTTFKTVKEKYLYRGFVLSRDNIDLLRSGASIPLESRLVSSWAITQYQARDFAIPSVMKKSTDSGVVIKIPSQSLDILLNYNNAIFRRFGLDMEEEVIVKGSGVSTIMPKDIVFWFSR